MKEKELQEYWTSRYEENRTGWDIGYPSTPIKAYVDQLENKDIKILIPGAGNAYEAEYLFDAGFPKVYVLDISAKPLEALKKRVPDFPTSQILQEDFFEHTGTYDLIIEQTFFCSFEPTPENRSKYAKKMSQLLAPRGKLVGLWFQHPLVPNGNRPFGGNKEEYLQYFIPYLTVKVLSECYNSIAPRADNELFGLFIL